MTHNPLIPKFTVRPEKTGYTFEATLPKEQAHAVCAALAQNAAAAGRAYTDPRVQRVSGGVYVYARIPHVGELASVVQALIQQPDTTALLAHEAEQERKRQADIEAFKAIR